jgi:hypothetical protein
MVKKYVKECEKCQVFANSQEKEEMWPTEPPLMVFGWVTIDVVHMPACRGKTYLVVARCYATQWPEARALSKNDSASVAKFVLECICCRWGVPLKMTCDGGPENKDLLIDLQSQFGVNRVVASAYNPQAQGVIERGHAPIIAALKKLGRDWVENLPLVL